MGTRNPNGMGSIYKRKKDDLYIWVRRQNGKIQTDSDKDLNALTERVRQKIGLPIIKNKTKVDEWFKSWLDFYILPIKKPATYEQYKIIYEQHIKPVIGNKLISKVQSHDIQEVIAEMAKKTRKIRRAKKKEDGTEEVIWEDTGEKLSTWTMKHAKKIMHSAFERARKEKYVSSNPVEDIEIPKRQAKERKTLNSEELSKLFSVLKNSRWIWAVKFLLVTGMRRGEILSLRWSDIDFANRRITVDESNSRTGLNDTKSANVHYIPLTDKAIEYLNSQKQMLEKEENPILVNEKLKESNIVFPSKYGTMLKPNSFYNMLSRYAKKAGIYATPHCIRHTFVYMSRKKLSLKELQSILGHDESTTTLDIYGNMLDESTDETARRIDEVFKDIDREIEKQESAKVIDFTKYKKRA